MHDAPASPAAKPLPHLASIDAIRGLGVLGVLITHSGDYMRLPQAMSGWTALAATGVQLFYIASAFTLFLSLDTRKREASPLRNFFLRRLFRIGPAFYLAMLLTFLVVRRWPFMMSPRPQGIDFLLGILFLHGFSAHAINSVTGGSWSIGDEVIFYALIPALHRWLTSLRRSIPLYAVTAVVFGALSGVLVRRYPQHDFLFGTMWFPIEFPVFLLGIIAYQVWKRFNLAHGASSSSHRLASLLLLLLVANLLRPGNAMLVNAAGAAVLVLALVCHPWPLLVNAFTRFLGKISYSMYLFHFFVLHGINLGFHALDRRTHGAVEQHLYGHVGGFAVYLLLLLGCSIPLCTLSWKYLEQPSMQWGRRLILTLEQHVGGRQAAPAETMGWAEGELSAYGASK